MVASVIVDIISSNVDKIFEYNIPENIKVSVGDRVSIPFANRIIEGYVIDISDNSTFDKDRLKDILRVMDSVTILSGEMIELAHNMKELYHVTLSSIIRLMVPPELRHNKTSDKNIKILNLNVNIDKSILENIKAKKQREIIDYFLENNSCAEKVILEHLFSKYAVNALIEKNILQVALQKIDRVPLCDMDVTNTKITLTKQQKQAVNKIINGGKRTYLLHGVTGSGKTEIYLNVIKQCLEKGKSAILLVPEISLTPSMLKNLRSRFGNLVAMLHSGLSAGERFDEWWRLKNGQARIVVGARSAIFAPLQNIDVIIIDEEHEQSYLSEISPKYNARDIAKMRCQFSNCPLVLASATPDIDSYYRAEKGEYTLIELSNRINERPMPPVRIVDMKTEIKQGNRDVFSAYLKNEIKKCIDNNHQAMLFINRRGYSTKLLCASCGYVAKCADCDIALTYHSDENLLRCHYCNNKYKVPQICPKCKSHFIKYSGAGTQKIEQELVKSFNGIRVLRLDFDTASKKDGHYKILRNFEDGKADVLVGTQMIAKGHDFKNVTLVGIIDADLSLFLSDFRSAERTFQLITQVAGRAGRDEAEGEVILQTYNPDNYIFKLIREYDYKAFYEREISLRQVCNFPPYTDIIRLLVASTNNAQAIEVLKKNYEDVLALKEKSRDAFIYLTKMKSPLKKLQNKYRYQLVIKLKTGNREIIDSIYKINEKNKENDVVSYVEVNPFNMN